MNRITLLAALVLGLLGAAVAFHVRPSFRPDVSPPALTLPEALGEAVVVAPLSVLPGLSLLTLAAIFLLLWRRGVGQSPILALVPGVLLLLHPAGHEAAATVGGRLDLVALAAVLFGAWLTTVERSGGVAFGVLLLFAGILTAPSGAVVAALSAFVLLERVPTMHRGAALLLAYGAARAFGAPWLGTILDPASFPASPALDPQPWIETLRGVVAGLVPLGAVGFVPASGPVWALAVVGGLLVLATLVAPAERRFGGRYAGPVAAIGILLAAASAREGGALPASALAPVLCVLGVWVAAIGDDVERRAWRRGLSSVIAVACVAAAAVGAWTGAARLGDEHRFFGSFATPEVAAAPLDARARVSLRARLLQESAIDRLARVERRLGTDVIDTRGFALVDRDLAVAAALAGSPERAVPLLERAVALARRLEDGALVGSLTLELVDVHLRESRPELALAASERARDGASPSHAGELRCRDGLAWFLRAYRPDSSGKLPALDARDRALAEARQAFDEAVELAPDSARARLERGRFQLAIGQSIDAVKDLEACVAARPALAAPHVELARLYFALEEDLDGERELSRARVLAGPNDPEVRLVTAQLQVAKGDVLGAVENAESLGVDVHRLRGGKGALSELYALLALVAEDQKNLGLAEAMATKALALATDRNGETTTRLARIFRQLRRFEDEVALLIAARDGAVPVEDLTLNIATAYKNAGYAHLLGGERREALDDYLAAVREIDDPETLGLAPKMVREIGDELGSEEDLREIADEARRWFEDGVDAYGAGHDDLAQRQLETSLALLPQNPYSHHQLGLIHRRNDRPEEARAAFEAAIRIGEALGREDVVESAKRLLRDDS